MNSSVINKVPPRFELGLSVWSTNHYTMGPTMYIKCGAKLKKELILFVIGAYFLVIC